jgi:hypothetical protein
MADVTSEEIESLQREFDWVLSTEVQSVIEQLRAAVQVEYPLFRILIQAVGESGSGLDHGFFSVTKTFFLSKAII